LFRVGLEVAVPARDRGVDLIAYADLSRELARFAARPLQMKAFTASGFSVAQKDTRIADLLLGAASNGARKVVGADCRH
jgi:hypothetical protein